MLLAMHSLFGIFGSTTFPVTVFCQGRKRRGCPVCMRAVMGQTSYCEIFSTVGTGVPAQVSR